MRIANRLHVAFANLPISAGMQTAVRALGHEHMTVTQAQCIPACLRGDDVLVRARTGTGKTIAFLLPSIERVGKARAPPTSVLVVSPTRELANQIFGEARKLAAGYPGMRVLCVTGGTNMEAEARQLTAAKPTVLVATPGRLLGHIGETPGMVSLLQNVKTLVIDEADQMLEMGFRPDLLRILKQLPPPSVRQTLLFSATVPDSLHSVKSLAMKPAAVFVDCIGPEDTATNVQVQQGFVAVPFDNHVAALEALLRQHAAQVSPHKIIVFFPTARVAGFMAQLFGAAGFHVLEMHSRKSQAYRTRTSDQFRKGTGAQIMFTSDVSARGVDYPGVTLVVQMGLPSDKLQYIHRLGRTARAGELGQGVLLLSPFELGFLRHLDDLPLQDYSALYPVSSAAASPAMRLSLSSLDAELTDSANKSFLAWLGYYCTKLSQFGISKTEVVKLANQYARTIGLKQPPAVPKRTAAILGLKGMPGLQLE